MKEYQISKAEMDRITEGMSPSRVQSLEEWRKSIPFHNPWYELIEEKRDEEDQNILVFKLVNIKDSEAIKGKHFKLKFEIIEDKAKDRYKQL